MSKVRVVLEAAKGIHPMAVHAYPSEKGKFVVHATGSKVEHVKKGDTVSSSDLDDLSDAGHKVKEVKNPNKKKVAEGYQRDSGYGHAADAHYKTLSSKMKDAVNLHLRKGKSYNDAVKAAKVHVKEDEDLEEGKMGSGGYRMKDGTYVPYKSYEKQGQEVRAKRAEAGRALVDADKKTRANAKEEVEQVDEKLTPEAKSAVKQALGPRTPGNPMRQGSKTARTIISLAKSNKKNVVPGTK